jgi:hypothetical protein
LAVAPANAGLYAYGNKLTFPKDSYLATGNFIDVEVQ